MGYVLSATIGFAVLPTFGALGLGRARLSLLPFLHARDGNARLTGPKSRLR